MRTWLRVLPAIVWMGVIFFLSHQPGETLEEGVLVWIQTVLPFVSDLNFGHFISYFILAVLVYIALGARWMNWRGKLLCIVICVLYGITDEFHQSFVPGRSPDLIDIRNDAIGAAIAMLIVSIRPIHKLLSRLHTGKKY